MTTKEQDKKPLVYIPLDNNNPILEIIDNYLSDYDIYNQDEDLNKGDYYSTQIRVLYQGYSFTDKYLILPVYYD